MIVFELACDCGYTFEGWFQDREDFEEQQTASFLICPSCGSRQIRKILSPNRTRSSKDIAGNPLLCDSNSVEKSAATAEKTLETLQDFICENFEDVGPKLAPESLKIHYGVSEPRNLRGVTTRQEEKKLREEGIELIKIPFPLKNREAN